MSTVPSPKGPPRIRKTTGATALWILALGLACPKKQPPVAPPAGTDAAALRAGGGAPGGAAGRDSGVAAPGPSFDCKRATTKIERLICSSAALSRLDSEVGAAFKQAQGRYLNPKVLRDLQRRWLLDVRNAAASASALDDVYTARLKELRDDIEEGQEQVRGELAWRMMVAGRTKDIVMPLITRWRNDKVKTRINAVLTKMAAEMGCPDEPGERAVHFEMRSAVTYAKNDIFSVDIHSGWYCGGPYPTNDANSSTTFDLRTGSPIAFKDLFANYPRDQDAVLRVVFGDEVADAEGEHVLTLGMIEGYPLAFSFHEDGLHMQPEFPHVIESLAEEAVAPYAQLKRFAARKGPLARIKD